ncbi:MAG: LPS export ABC transporter permease LptG, partial [Burkholderiales bacterium]
MILARYILKKCLFNTLLMIIAFVMLFSIFSILGQIGDVGKGQFTTVAMLVYTALLIPNYLYLLMPLAILIGVMLSMLSLVNYSEYAIIRTSGVSLRRITAVLLTFGISFSLITFMLGEVLAPETNHYAQVYKITKTKEVVSTQLHSGIWSKDGENNFVNIKQVMPDNTILGVHIFKDDDNLKLLNYIEAEVGDFNPVIGTWVLHNVKQYDYSGQDIQLTNIPEYQWRTSITPNYFSVLVILPEDMSAFGLLKYMHHLAQNNQSTQRYQIAFWNKL